MIRHSNSMKPDPHDMKTLVLCLGKLVQDGYTDDFRATKKGLMSSRTDRLYPPDQIHVINSVLFERFKDPADNAIMYVIETDDGLKGTLIDSWGKYADPKVNRLMEAIEKIKKH